MVCHNVAGHFYLGKAFPALRRSSVVVGGLRKYESAGLIDSRSLGAKGTYVKVLDTSILSVMKNYAQKQAYINSNLHNR